MTLVLTYIGGGMPKRSMSARKKPACSSGGWGEFGLRARARKLEFGPGLGKKSWARAAVEGRVGVCPVAFS